MATNEGLITFIREGLGKGVSREQLTQVLTQNGWTLDAINEGFVAVTAPVVVQMTPQDTLLAGVQAQAQSVATAPATPVTPVMQVMPQQKAKLSLASIKKPALITLGILVLLSLAGGVAYAYFYKIGPFARIPYTESNLFSGLLAKGAEINSSSYSFSGELKVEPRDTDAVPFTLQVTNEGALREQYQHDAERASVVSSFLNELSRSGAPYPSTLQGVLNRITASGRNYSRYPLKTVDPVSGKPYEYKVSPDGQNFSLTVTFETPGATSQIKRGYSFSEESTRIEGKTVTFTKDSSPYMYLSTEPPKPFLISLGEMMQYLPGELQATVGVSAQSEWKNENADWKFNVDAEGDFGDLTYKINVDALKKDALYYFRVNNIPSLFMSSLPIEKGQWVKIDPSLATSTDSYSYNQFSSFASSLESGEKQYKEERAQLVEFMKKMVIFADEEKLARFKNPPHSETVDGQLLYRYDIETRKEALLPFYKKLVAEAQANKGTTYSKLLNDPGMIDYLESEEFSQVFDYVQKNTTTTLWVDTRGYPARLEYSMRIVPLDTATSLKDKQVRVTWTMTFSDINKPVDIQEPKDAKPLQEVIDGTAMGTARNKGSAAALKSNLATIQVQAELYYDTNNSYSKTPYPLGVCSNVPNTLFSDTTINRAITSAVSSGGGAGTCVASKDAYAVAVPIKGLTGYQWCIDSTGNSKQITGALTSSVCQ